MKTYEAMVWEDNLEKPDRRVTLAAESLDDAKRQLEEKFGKGHVFNLHNEEDAKKPR
ncbi:hypothetical protein [Bradyrhizobium sp. McL0615]|uniref:hypothetical protein n=1 Tax=Bradyrhizobium sp. McL0615 TaxID=3415673 RepID=UPI003CE91468